MKTLVSSVINAQKHMEKLISKHRMFSKCAINIKYNFLLLKLKVKHVLIYQPDSLYSEDLEYSFHLHSKFSNVNLHLSINIIY